MGCCQTELPKTQYFRTKKPQKMLIICQIDCREVGVASSCNALAIARFLVKLYLCSKLYFSGKEATKPMVISGNVVKS